MAYKKEITEPIYDKVVIGEQKVTRWFAKDGSDWPNEHAAKRRDEQVDAREAEARRQEILVTIPTVTIGNISLLEPGAFYTVHYLRNKGDLTAIFPHRTDHVYLHYPSGNITTGTLEYPGWYVLVHDESDDPYYTLDVYPLDCVKQDLNRWQEIISEINAYDVNR